ncbi:hypothetical protein BGZ65_002421 [Modicella reniformis]|uniref:Sphingomyelin synthase-like domain-containing protein n=1 Tax=Modicella reniformis TaxID=1440133 RepID=A0A9P6LZF6_9FUNG|nr:hypothetical protein BGZ65_002421 [Modicella reniformis]
MDPHTQHIHIGQLDEVHDQSNYSFEPYGAYESKDSLEMNNDMDQDQLNRFSCTSTLIGGNTPRPRADIKPTVTATRARNNNGCCNKKRGFWYRFMHSEAGRLVCAIIFFTVICIGMAFCNQLSDHRWVETAYTKVLLRDRGFDVITAQADIQPANTFVMTSVLFTVLGIGLICPSWTTRAIVLRRILWVIGVLSAYRAMTLSVTTLPTPKEECHPSLKTGFWEMFIVALQMIPGTVEACTDDIFSGHTVFMVTCAIQWRLYCKNKWITYFSYFYISIGLYFVVATRLHYTVDVVLAVFITFAVWSIYISMIDVVMEEEYFGIESHHEKYKVFDNLSTEYEFAQDEDDDINSRTILHIRRRQLEHTLNRLRGPRIGYGRGEYDRVAFLPVQFNTWLKGLIRWCDGLDLRMRADENSEEDVSRWDELVVRYRSEQVSNNSFQASRVRRKADEGLEECDERIEGYRQQDGSILESIRIHGYSFEARQQQHGRWRSSSLRSASPRRRSSSSLKEEKEDKMDRKRKLRIIKIAFIIFINVILLTKLVQVIQSRVNSAPPSHWPQEMESYPGGAIYTNDTPASITAPNPQQQPNHDNNVEIEPLTGGNLVQK